MKKISIVVSCHKPDPYIRTEYPYIPVNAGRKLHPDILTDFVGDDTGDNVSERNGEWSEVTALYWAWKNLPKSEYFGLAHYRRYIGLDIRDETVDDIMKGYDMIVTERSVPGSSLATYLELLTNKENFWLFLDTLASMHPEAGDLIIDYFFNQNSFYPNQVFLCRWELMDEYCQFLMPLMIETEKRLLGSGYSRQRRVIAYLAEFMLGFYVAYRGLKVKEVKRDQTFTLKPVSGGRTFKTVLHRKIFFTSEKLVKNLYFHLFTKVPHYSFIIADEDVQTWFARDGVKLRVLDKPLYYSK